MSLLATILIGAVTAIIGGVIGFVYASRGTNQAKRTNELQERFDSTERELKQYRQEVTEHFKETARVVGNLTEAYRDVHNHLAIGASRLTPATLDEPLLKTLPDQEELDAISKAPMPEGIQAPLDYAPKTSDNRVGMLDESYGLDSDDEPEKLEQLTIKAEQAAS